MIEDITPMIFDSVMTDGGEKPLHAYVYICKACVKKLNIPAYDSVIDESHCQVVGCRDVQADYIHTIYDYRKLEHELEPDEIPGIHGS